MPTVRSGARRGAIALGWTLLALASACDGARTPEASTSDSADADETRVAITRPTVIAYLVVPPGAVDTMPDLAIVADDWNHAMATLGDSLETNGFAFAMATERTLLVSAPGMADAAFALDSTPAAGYVLARPGATPCIHRGAAELEEVLAEARAFFEAPAASTSSRWCTSPRG